MLGDEEFLFSGTIEVTGSGEVEVAPDLALVALLVITQAKTAAAASVANVKRTRAVIDAVASEPHSRISTAGLGVSPITSYDPETNINRILGYRATNSVEVETRAKHAGRIYDAGVEAGAKQSSDIRFRVADERRHRELALRSAVEQACADARLVAETAAFDLAGVERIVIDPGSSAAVYRASALAAELPPSPVLPNDVTITARVRLVLRTKA